MKRKGMELGAVLAVIMLSMTLSITPVSAYEVGIVWVKSYPSGTLYDAQLSAERFYNKIGGTSSWTKKFNKNDSNAYEKYLKRSDYTGGQDSSYIDNVDIAMFVGHGTDRNGQIALKFITSDTDEYLQYNEAKWGDKDLEWIGLDACRVLNDASRWHWANSLNGTHLIAGFATDSMAKVECGVEGCTTYTMGEYWADYMVDDGFFDLERTVKNAWFEAADDSQFPNSDIVVKVIGENADCGGDDLWGQGPVISDPPVDNSYTVWSHNV